MRVQLTNGMFVALVMSMMFVKAIGVTQGVMAREVGNDIWLATLFSILQGILVMMITVWTLSRAPEHNLIEQVSMLLGKWAGRLAGVLVFFFFLGAYGAAMITFVYHLMDYFLPEMPIAMFVITICVVCVYAANMGLEVIARLAFVGVFSICLLNALLLAGSMKEFDIRELLPVMQSGFLRTIWTSRHLSADWGNSIMMTTLILPAVRDKRLWNRSGVMGIVYGGIMVMLWPILELGILSPEVTSQYLVSCMQLARAAEIPPFFQRYELGMVVLGLIPIVVQMIMSMLCASLAVSQTLGMRDFRPTILPVAGVLSGFSYWVVLDHFRAMALLTNVWPLVALPLAVGLPVAFWVLGLLFKKKRAKEEESSGAE